MSAPRGNLRSVHMMGIGGAGMCALAEVLLDDGVEVSGCDMSRSERTDRLEARGARISLRHDPDHIAGVDALIVTAAIPTDHNEIKAAHDHDTPVIRRSMMLANILHNLTVVAVAGTHGKTTTSALLAHCLHAAGADPTVVVGGLVRGLEVYGRRGAGSVAVCEADEYDHAFLKLDPTFAVLTNVEPDHLDYFGSQARLEQAFVDFLDRLPGHGKAFVCGDDPAAMALAGRSTCDAVSYGLDPTNTLRAADIHRGPESTSFDVVSESTRLGRVTTPLAGEHNIRNTLAVVGVGLELGHSLSDLSSASASFRGAGRRFERLGVRNDVTVIDDYAHHPTEIKALLAAARQAYPGHRLVALFQPHLFSRTRDLAIDFADALGEAEALIVLPIFAAREQAIEGISHHLIADALPHGTTKTVRTDLTLDSAPAALNDFLKAGDVLLTIGAGDVDTVAKTWLGATA